MNNTELVQMDEYYNRMMNCSSTSGRHYNFKKMLDLFNASEIVRQVWDYVQDAFLIVKRFVKRAYREISVRTYGSKFIQWSNGASNFEDDGVEQLYLIKLIGENQELVWSKVGTTTRKTIERMKEHLRYYSKYGIERIIVDRVYDCGDMSAEYYENLFKSFYMLKYGKELWRKNDRFCGVAFDLDEADKKFGEWRVS